MQKGDRVRVVRARLYEEFVAPYIGQCGTIICVTDEEMAKVKLDAYPGDDALWLFVDELAPLHDSAAGDDRPASNGDEFEAQMLAILARQERTERVR